MDLVSNISILRGLGEDFKRRIGDNLRGAGWPARGGMVCAGEMACAGRDGLRGF